MRISLKSLSGAFTALALVGFVAAAPVSAQQTVTFDNDPKGAKTSPFTSADSSDISFSASPGGELVVIDQDDVTFPLPSGQALAVLPDDPSFLIMDFTSLPATFLSLDFGNDDAFFAGTDIFASLTTFFNGTQVGQVRLMADGDDRTFQTIFFSQPGIAFDRATFRYEDAAGSPLDIAEVVDNVRFQLIPEPGTYALIASGLLPFAGAALRRRRKS